MSSTEEQVTNDEVEEVCANCGKAAVDDVKLKICTACKLVKYCSVDCQKNHRKQHKKACKKRAAEIRDTRLFKQPDESNLGECPICCLPLPLDGRKWVINTCCCKMICNGCSHANYLREAEQGLEYKCVYCREEMPKTDEEADQNYMKRIKVNDPIALFLMGKKRYLEGDYEGAFQYWTKAAELGNMESHHNLSVLYDNGEGVAKDEKKKVYHAEEAAIGGHPAARFNLANYEGEVGRYERATKHFVIAANLGDDEALEKVKENFRRGFVSKEDFEAALRGHQAAVDATKSTQRDVAEEYNSQENQY
jgi:tetratricopeptide (TPR) repeat protein